MENEKKLKQVSLSQKAIESFPKLREQAQLTHSGTDEDGNKDNVKTNQPKKPKSFGYGPKINLIVD